MRLKKSQITALAAIILSGSASVSGINLNDFTSEAEMATAYKFAMQDMKGAL